MRYQLAKPHALPAEFEQERSRILNNLVLLLSGLGLASALALLASQGHGYPAAIGVCVLVTLAAFMGGGGLGFLFALPRVLSDSAPAPVPAPGGGGAAAPATARQAAAARLLQSNTNLERISDWLTTMLVGVSLTQLTNVPRLMWQFRLFLEETAPVFGEGAAATAGWLPMVGCILLVLAALAGFMATYLYMRLVLVRLFLQAEIDLHQNGRRGEPLPEAAEQEVRDLISDPATADPARQSFLLSQEVLSVGDALDLINDELHDENFDRAIQIAESLVRTSAAKDPDYWLYRAAAYGQKHHSLLDAETIAANPNAGAEREAARKEVLRAAREAIKLDRGYRSTLWALTNKRSFHNDLQDFAEDAEFSQVAQPRAAVRRR